MFTCLSFNGGLSCPSLAGWLQRGGPAPELAARSSLRRPRPAGLSKPGVAVFPVTPDPGDTRVLIRVCALLAVDDAQQPAKNSQSSRGAGAPAVPECLLLHTFTVALLADPRKFLPLGSVSLSPFASPGSQQESQDHEKAAPQAQA